MGSDASRLTSIHAMRTHLPMREQRPIDPVLAALQRAPLVPLTEHEQQLLAEVDITPEPRIPHANVVSKLYERPDAA